MTLRTQFLLIACVALVSLSVRDSRACGALVFNEESAGSIVDQEIVIAAGADRTIIVTSVGYTDAQSDFAFLLPVQKAPLAVYDGDPKLFATLQDETVPRVAILEDSSAGSSGCCGAFPGAARSGAGAPGGGEVQVISRGETNTYEYVVVGGKSAATLADWLEKEKFAPPPGLQKALDEYIRNRWLFLAARLKPKAVRGSLAPIEIQMPPIPVAELKYPFGLSAQSVPPTKSVDILIYLMSIESMLPANYDIDRIKSSDLRSLSQTESNYKEVSSKKLAKEVFLVEYGRGDIGRDEMFRWADPPEKAVEGEPPPPLAKSHDTLFPKPFSITRLHGRLGSKALRDMSFKAVALEDLIQDRNLLVHYDSKVGASAIGLLLAVTLFRRGTKRKRRHSMPKRALFSAKN